MKENSKAVKINLYDIDKTIDDIARLKRHQAVVYRAIDSNHTILLEYSTADSTLWIYYCDNDKYYDIFKGSLETWRSEILNGRINPEDKDKFNRLVDDIAKCSRFITEDIDIDLFGNGEIKSFILNAGAVVTDSAVDTLGGTLAYKDINNRADLFNEFNKDPMTGVLNKRAIVKYAKDRLDMRKDEDITLAILDLDHFKSVNDVLGHAAGDSAIIRFSDIIRIAVGNNGAVGRFGGDEFMVVIDNVRDELQLREYFRSIRMATQLEFKDIGLNVPVTCSIGIAQVTSIENADYSYENLFKIADYCLYMAKEYGRNRYVIYDDRSKKLFRPDGTVGENRYSKSVQNNRLVLSITNLLFTKGLPAINEVLSTLGTMYELDNVNLFYGEDFKLVYHWGTTSPDKINAKYLFEDNYMSKFNDDGLYPINTVPSLKARMPNAYHYLEEQSIYSAVQFLIRDTSGNPKGLISYEVIPEPGRYWHEDETSNLTILSQLISQIIRNNYSA
jgi:diguanylate cyclase (GGDEF)-like protein